ncbi:MAG: TlpA family protein disulfide reductase [Phototrophicaceae bacterium]|jgi:thiol-disulfide isomerase/thioredoxin
MKSVILLAVWIACLITSCTVYSPSFSPLPLEQRFEAPAFAGIGLDGIEYHSSDFNNRWVILNFWATWCEPCVSEMEALQGISNAYPTVQLVGINVGESLDEVEAFRQTYGLRFFMLVEPDSSTILNYQVTGIPRTYIISPAGEVVAFHFGPIAPVEDFENLLEGFLGQ